MLNFKRTAAILLALLVVLVASQQDDVNSAPLPSGNQLRAMDVGLAMFIHYSVDPWSTPHTEHNCVGHSPDCIPASKFDPTDLSTDQWVEAAVAMGASEICLTAHHEGGFCLWDTKYTNYSVMHSPYGKDVVEQFVASCKKYGVKPCYYMGPNANGYLSNKLKLSAEEFVQTQLGMLNELLTNYDLQPSRLWWDHYGKGCAGEHGLNPCPEGSFPDAWVRFVDLVRALSPDTIICPGPDCDGHQGESGVGKYPTWNPCHPEDLQCSDHAPDASLTGFHPYEACATMVKGAWFCQGDGSTQNYWSAGEIWDHYMASVGIGWINTLNAPACTTGRINENLVKEMTVFGQALKSLFATVRASESNIDGETCDGTSTLVELTPSDGPFNAVILKEDLSQGQRITEYAIDYFDKNKQEWVPSTSKGVHGQSVGNLLIDWLDPAEAQAASKLRVRCVKAMQVPVHLKSASLHSGARPDGGKVETALE